MKESIEIKLKSKKQFELINITEKLIAYIGASKVKSGIAIIFNPHTTAAIRMTHDEPLLMQDIMKAMYRMVPKILAIATIYLK